MSLSIQRYTVIALLLAGAFLLRPVTARSQSIQHVYGNPCVGLQNVYTFAGNGSVTSWSVVGNYTIVSSSSSTLVVVWNQPTSGASVSANYTGSSGSGSVWTGSFSIGTTVTPTVSISANTNNVCQGTPITFTASQSNGGSSPSYTWYVNNNLVSGATGSTYTTSSLTPGSQVYCMLFSNYPCVTSNTAQSNIISPTINARQNMTATINGNSTICGSASVGFSVGMQNSGGNLTYQWKRNGNNVSSNQGSPPPYALAYGPVNNGDVFQCVVTSDGCYNQATSNSVTIAITQPQAFSVSVGPTTGISYCTGQTVTFTANANAGVSSYQWQQNGGNIPGATGSSYTTTVTSLAQLQGIGVYVTGGGGGCITGTTATANAANIPFTVNTSVTPSVSIGSSAGASICSGSSVTFTATAVNGGSSPQYQWMLNGSPVSGATASTWTTSGLTNGQQVSCQLTSSAVCATSTTVNSNAITMTVNTIQQMGITISGSSSICQGSAVGYGAAVTNTAGNLTYQWMKNGSDISSDGPGAGNVPPYALHYEEVNDGDVFSCRVSSDAACYLPATSNGFTVHVNTPQPFTAGIGTTAISLCQDHPVTLSASASSTPLSYQWMFNGTNIVGATGPTYQTTATSVADLHSFTVLVTTDLGQCITSTQATGTSAQIPFNISPNVPTAVSFSPSDDIRIGTPVTFTTTALNPGDQPTYQWQLNGQDIQGATGPTYTKNFQTGAEYQTLSVTMVSNAWCAITPASSTAQYPIHLADWENLNYIRVHEVHVAGVNDWIGVGATAMGDKTENTTYFDGVGRPIQHVDREAATPASPGGSWGDIVTPGSYDPLGRSPQGYLPYTTTTTLGQFKTSPLTEQAQYYTNNYNESSAYTQVGYENSPLNRVMNTKSAGAVWAGSSGNSIAYDLNDQLGDNVQIWTAGDNPGDGPVNQGVYLSNRLYKTTNTDSKGNLVIIYTDNSGQVILKKVEVNKTHANPYDGWMCTYFVYDDRGLVRFTLQPEAVNYLQGHSWSFSGTTILDDLCFRYEYDDRGRLTLKKSPGAQPLYSVYDNRDRLVFQQDGNQRTPAAHEWTAILYDELDRPVLNTLYESTASASTLQSLVPTGNTLTTMTVSAQGATVRAFNSPLAGADLNNSSVTTILKYYFYDDYGYPGVKAFSTNFDNSQAYPTSDPMTPTQRTLGMVTGKMLRVLGTSNFLSASLYYDEPGRPLQRAEDNIKSGQDVITNQYRFDDALLSKDSKHSTANTGITNFGILTKFGLDSRGRVTSLQKQYGTNAFKTVAAFDLDDMGRIKTKHLDPGYTGSGKNELESLTYSFNINSQLTGINRDYALKTAGKYDKWGHFFGLYLGYDNTDGMFTNNQLDGQAAGVVWSTQGDDVQRKYDYSYDPAGRFINAAFAERALSTDPWSHTQTDFSVTGESGQITYDLNGNLTNLIHRGVVQGNQLFQSVDDLHYQYATLSNKLTKVSDNGTMGPVNGWVGDFVERNTTGGDDYIYDANGNLVIDNNKSISGIGGADGTNGVHYNFLDRPETIRIQGKGTVRIVYDAEGNKLQRSFTPEGSSTATTTSYINEFTYQGDNLQYINFEEGRIRVMQAVPPGSGLDVLNIDGNIDLPGGNRGAYDYFIRDQLGSVRMVLTEETHSASDACTMELSRDGVEPAIFGQVDASGAPTAANEVKARFPVGSIPGQSTGGGWNDASIGSWVSQVGNYAASHVGPNMLVKVMAGDQIAAQTQYYYKDPVTNPVGGPSSVTDVITALAAAIAGGPATTGPAHSALGASGVVSNLTGNVPFAAGADPDAQNGTGDKPKAYLTVLFFDERFNFIGEGSQAVRVQTSGGATLPFPPTRAPKNGYAFIYVSNESDEMVYFDNMQVSTIRGNILQESHYYPHGLKMMALSSSAMGLPNEGKLANNYEYQGDNAETDPDIGWTEFALRDYDPQIGRFVQQDPYDQFASPYVGMGNDPVNSVDPDGGFSVPGAVIGGMAGFIVGGAYALANNEDPVKGAVIGMAGGALLGGVLGDPNKIFPSFGDTQTGTGGLNISGLRGTNPGLAAALLTQLHLITGLFLGTDGAGNVTYQMHRGWFNHYVPTVANFYSSSRYARKMVVEMVDEDVPEQVVETNNPRLSYVHGSDNVVNLHPDNDNVEAHGVDPMTAQIAMVFLHEYGHTGTGGNYDDVDRANPSKSHRDQGGINEYARHLNRIRRQMSRNNYLSWGERSDYSATPDGGTIDVFGKYHGWIILPFNKTAVKEIRRQQRAVPGGFNPRRPIRYKFSPKAKYVRIFIR